MDASTQGVLQADTSERQAFFIIVTLPFTSTRVVVAEPQTRVFAGALGVKFCFCVYKTALRVVACRILLRGVGSQTSESQKREGGFGGGLEGQLTVGLQTG